MTDFVFRVGQCEGKFFVQASDKKDMYLFKNGIVENWHIMGGKIGYETNDKDSFFDTLDDANAAIANYKRDSKKKYKYDFPMAGMTADCIMLHKFDDVWKVLLIRRGGNPCKGMLALPGGFVNVETETVKNAAIRETLEEVSVVLRECDVDFFEVADKVDRDPRGRTISFIFSTVLSDEQVAQAKAGDDAASYDWYVFDRQLVNSGDIAFDHADILYRFLNRPQLTISGLHNSVYSGI
jgi:8-oxo-dGTP diphosphatase